MNIAIYVSTILFVGFILLAVISGVVKRSRLKSVQKVFQKYNENKDTGVLVTWIQEKHTGLRLLLVLDYLFTIEAYEIAAQVFNHFNAKAFSNRHILIFAARAYLACQQVAAALPIAEQLYQTNPKDDSFLDLYVECLLDSQQMDQAKKMLQPRLAHKFKGTIFARHYARILAHEGDTEQAITIMENAVERDYILFSNTIAQPQKNLIKKQWLESKAILESIQKDQADQ